LTLRKNGDLQHILSACGLENVLLGYEKKIDSFKTWKSYADLAIQWNCSAVAFRSIFDSANCDYWKVRWSKMWFSVSVF